MKVNMCVESLSIKRKRDRSTFWQEQNQSSKNIAKKVNSFKTKYSNKIIVHDSTLTANGTFSSIVETKGLIVIK